MSVRPELFFRFYLPSAALSPHLLLYWNMRSSSPLSPYCPARYRALPSGYSDLVFNLSGAPLQNLESTAARPSLANAFFTGLADHSIRFNMQGDVDLFGIRFHHGSLRDFLRNDMDELAGKQVEAEALFGKEIPTLLERLSLEQDNRRRIRMLEHAWAAKLSALHPPHPAIAATAEMLMNYRGELRIFELANRSGISQRQFERIYKQYIGLGPKRIAEIGRFSQAGMMIKSGHGACDTAFTLGYADQAHMIRAFKRYCGLTPTAYLAEPDVGFVQDDPYALSLH